MQAVPGFFEQTEKDGVRLKPHELADSGFGLIDESPERWTNFKKKIEGELRRVSCKDVP